MRARKPAFLFSTMLFILMVFLPNILGARYMPGKKIKGSLERPGRVLIIDGSNVHNVGELWMHFGNWGMVGSMPGSSMPFSSAPSAEWPGGSGVEYLFNAGLWVGAIKAGIPAVSTAANQFEFRPTEDPIDIIYRTSEGADGGTRAPFPFADDDGDGLTDEDRLDGHDNDGDGLIDEDFAAISKQMFSCWFTDNQPISTQIYPEHDPLDIMVKQESYQWEDDLFDDYIGIEYRITNIGTNVLDDVYIGIFADCDIGHRDTPDYWLDDASGYVLFPAWCTSIGAAQVDAGYMFDADGDGGQTPGYFGAMFLGHPTDPAGVTAPARVGIASFASFSGSQSFEDGGDPTNDFERYEILSSQTINSGVLAPTDTRILISAGPFRELFPDSTIILQVAFVVGNGLIGMAQNAANAQLSFNGKWFDIDGDELTGIDARETPVYGPATDVIIDACRPGLSDPIDVAGGEVVWINADCEREAFHGEACNYGAADSLLYKTGTAGRETNVHWTISEEIPNLPVEVGLDLRPGSCPNPFSSKFFDFLGPDKPKKGGVLPVAVLGSEIFDVHEIDVSTLRLQGVSPRPHGQGFKDVAAPVTDTTNCACTEADSDSFTDLKLKFRNMDIAAAISSGGSDPPDPGDIIELTLTGNMNNGTPIVARDCLKIVGRRKKPKKDDDREQLKTPYPNPFNPVTRITYYLSQSGHVRLAVYDIAGRLVEVLHDGFESEGEKTHVWNGGKLASGVYFVRLEAGGEVTTKRVVLLK